MAKTTEVDWRKEDKEGAIPDRQWARYIILACDLRKEAHKAGVAIDLFEKEYTIDQVKRILSIRQGTTMDERIDELHAEFQKRKPAAAE